MLQSHKNNLMKNRWDKLISNQKSTSADVLFFDSVMTDLMETGQQSQSFFHQLFQGFLHVLWQIGRAAHGDVLILEFYYLSDHFLG